MKPILPVFAALAAIPALLAGGCFDRRVPHPERVAESLAELEAARGETTILDLTAAEGLEAFPEGLGACPALRRLWRRGLKAAAEVPASIAEAKGLAELDLSETGLKDLPPEAATLPALRHLYLSDNGLTALPAAVCGMTGLTYLNLDRNALTNLPEEVGALKGLKWVRLNGNKLSDLPASAAEWKDIRRLYLRGNGLKKVPDAVLAMTSLEQLDLGGNDLESVPEALCALPHLQRLDLDGNPRLAALPMAITNMPELTHLFVYRTGISTAEVGRVRAAKPDAVRFHIGF